MHSPQRHIQLTTAICSLDFTNVSTCCAFSKKNTLRELVCDDFEINMPEKEANNNFLLNFSILHIFFVIKVLEYEYCIR